MKRSPLIFAIKVFAGSFIKGEDEISFLNTKTPPKYFVFMVPVVGFEPTPVRDLNPMRLPIAQYRHVVGDVGLEPTVISQLYLRQPCIPIPPIPHKKCRP